MPNYRRTFVPGGTWFFTVNLLERQDNNLLLREIATLRQVVQRVKARYPFEINAWVVLPEHLHAVLTLPPGDSDFSLRWCLIKSGFSRALPKMEYISPIRLSAKRLGNEASGNGTIGNTASVMRRIISVMWIMCM